ncbi:TBC1 domain family member 14 [Striga asiatica]|uniref:TBC1 domain family member 14 n=1 Tax=Striga asiatica TaxID=4170 RepID=A0A5A7PH12_STRAF|nr:TBC1 domain family member 14 [Striga asiatica]
MPHGRFGDGLRLTESDIHNFPCKKTKLTESERDDTPQAFVQIYFRQKFSITRIFKYMECKCHISHSSHKLCRHASMGPVRELLKRTDLMIVWRSKVANKVRTLWVTCKVRTLWVTCKVMTMHGKVKHVLTPGLLIAESFRILLFDIPMYVLDRSLDNVEKNISKILEEIPAIDEVRKKVDALS